MVRKISPLLLALALAVPSGAGETRALLGVSYGGLRNDNRKVFASAEVGHQLGDGPFGLWGAVEGFTGDGGYIGAGPLLMWSPGSNWVIAGGSGPGVYVRQDGENLGYALEFRSTFYVAHRLGHAGWLGASISHYSNAHLGSCNPGAETVRLFWSFTIPRR